MAEVVESTTEVLDINFLMGVPLAVAAQIVDETKRLEREKSRLEIGWDGVKVFRGKEVERRLRQREMGL